MSEDILMGLAFIIVLGISASWLAWRLRLPSILLLLVFGFIAGPVTGFLNPDGLLGELVLPLVSLSVAVILFEGGLSLRIAELRKSGSVVVKLVTVGVLVSWLLGSLVAYFVLDLDVALAVLLGAILVVTGPTVILPLLRHLRPSGQVDAILRWEGIIIDPIGAILAVLVFQGIIAGEGSQAVSLAVLSLLKSIFFGGIIGAVGALILVQMLKRYWIPDFLHSVVSLALVIAAFTASNFLQTDSGLISVTLMGIILANQKSVNVRHIIEFKENLRVILISALFILLTARLNLDEMAQIGVGSAVLLAVLILVARPLAVFLSTLKSKLRWKERLFIAWLAPRGIVAAAVASVFAIRLADAGYTQAELLVPLTFVVIAATVAAYGLSAEPVARWLEVAEPDPQGVLIIGGHSWARAIASALNKEEVKVLIVDTNWANISAARMQGLSAFYGNILSQYTLDEIELGGIGRLLALTSDNEYNSLAALQLANDLGRSKVYQLPVEGGEKEDKKAVSHHLRGRLLFNADATYISLARYFASGAIIKTTELSEEFDYDAFTAYYTDRAISLFVIDQSGKMTVFEAGNVPKPKTGQKLVSIILPEKYMVKKIE